MKVDARSGQVVLVDSLDHETQLSHHLVIAARYGSLINLAKLTVHVADINDCAPRFISNHYEAKVSSVLAIGYRILQVQAIDTDVGINARLRYAISSGKLDAICATIHWD